MAVNKPTGDNARKGAVKKRTQLKNPLTKTSTKRNKDGGQFMAVKKSAVKYKGVRRKRSDEARRSSGNHPHPAYCVLGLGDCSMTWEVSGSSSPSRSL